MADCSASVGLSHETRAPPNMPRLRKTSNRMTRSRSIRYTGVYTAVLLATGVAASSAGDRHSVLGGGPLPVPRAQAVPTAAASTVAVIPFSNITGDAADDWIGAGLAESVMADLRDVPGLSVIGREVLLEARRSLGEAPDRSDERVATDLGRELGVTWLVAGGYQRVGDLIRITARLVDVASGSVIRTAKIDGAVSELVSLQAQIVSQLGDEMGLAGRSPVAAELPRRSAPSGAANAEGAQAEASEGILLPQRRSAEAASPQDTAGGTVAPADVAGGLTIDTDAAGPGRPTQPSGPGRGGRGAPAAGGAAGGPVLVGGRPTINAVRTSTPPDVDGRLDDVVWRDAVRITEFVQTTPVEGAAATEDTEVYIAYDDSNIYFGFYVHYSDPSLIRAYRVDRDRIWRDDKMSVYFDTFLDQQRAYVFSVNGYGIQGDSLMGGGGRFGGRGGGGGGGFRGGFGGVPRGDSSWDALFDSAGGLVADGWTAEISIPFKSLRYPSRGSGEPHSWGFQIVRSIRSKDETVVWSPVSRGISGFLTQMGVLQNMTSLSTSRNLEILPTFTGIQVGSLDTTTGVFADDDVTPEGGLNVKYGVMPNLTADFTVNPDFSQIESDRPQIEVNQRFPLFFSELRPFFLEGQEVFSTRGPANLVHTRTIVDPRFGGKLTGKVGKVTLGVLVADDEAPGKRDDRADPAFGQTAQFFIGRFRYDMYSESYIGAIVTDREFMDAYSRVAGIDGRFRLGQTNDFDFRLVQSSTRREDGTELSGPTFNARFGHNGRNLSYSVSHSSVDPDFRTEAGFVRRTDTRDTNTNASYRWWPESWLINWAPRFSYSRNYNFDGVLEDEGINGGLNFSFARNIGLGISANRDMEQFGGINFWGWQYRTFFNVSTSRVVSVLGRFNWGDEIRFSATPFLGRSIGGWAMIGLRPFSRLQSSISANLSRLVDPRTDAEVFDVKIFRTETTYQFTERLLLRNIMEYNTFDRTLDANLLVTYRVNSGTVFYVGYDDHYEQGNWIDPLLFPTNEFRQTNCAFFAKFSYLFRY